MSHLKKISSHQKLSRIVEVFRIWKDAFKQCLQLDAFLRGNTDIYAYRTQVKLASYPSKTCADPSSNLF